MKVLNLGKGKRGCPRVSVFGGLGRAGIGRVRAPITDQATGVS